MNELDLRQFVFVFEVESTFLPRISSATNRWLHHIKEVAINTSVDLPWRSLIVAPLLAPTGSSPCITAHIHLVLVAEGLLLVKHFPAMPSICARH